MGICLLRAELEKSDTITKNVLIQYTLSNGEDRGMAFKTVYVMQITEIYTSCITATGQKSESETTSNLATVEKSLEPKSE